MGHSMSGNRQTAGRGRIRAACGAICAAALGVSSMIGAAPASAQVDETPPAPFDVSDGRQVWQGSETNGPNGLFVGPDGNVYVASVFGGEITVHNRNTGEVLDRIGAERGVKNPDDVTIAPDGTLYWTDILNGTVGMLRPDGTFKDQFVGVGVNPITMSDDGRLFVARDFLGDGLFELDPDLEADPIVLIPDLFAFNGMDFGPDGLLYGPLFFGGAIGRIDVDAPELGVEVVVDGFTIPAAVAFNSQGELHAVDLALGTVNKVDLDAGTFEVIGATDANIATLDNLAFDANDKLFTTTSNGELLRLRSNGKFKVLVDEGFTGAGPLAVTDNGDLWVGQGFSLHGFDAGALPATGPKRSFPYRFFPGTVEPSGADTVSAAGDLLILASGIGGMVQVFDPATETVVESYPAPPGLISVVMHGDRLVGTQLGVGVVDIVTGEVIDANFAYPLGLDTDTTGLISDEDTLYVSDWALGTITAITDDGSTVVASGLAQPEGIALDGDGDRMFVVEAGLDQVTVVDLDFFAAPMPYIVGLDLNPDFVENPFQFPHGVTNGVAVGLDRTIYVSQEGANAVFEFDPAARTDNQVAFITGNRDDLPGVDQTLVGGLQAFGYEVLIVDDDDLDGDADLDSYRADLAIGAAEAILISTTIQPDKLPASFATLDVPIGTLEAYVADDLGLATRSFEQDTGSTAVIMQADVADHPLSAGLTGYQAVAQNPARLSVGIPGGDAIVVATTAGKPKLPTYYAYEQGTTMANGAIAPARRVAAFPTYQSLQDPGRVAGFILFATGMAWLTGQI